uniref:Uncharacterized protein n=1 Tax=Anguilla anguilla TaxID=7936 RepID=A0A0E9RU49_ANGAN
MKHLQNVMLLVSLPKPFEFPFICADFGSPTHTIHSKKGSGAVLVQTNLLQGTTTKQSNSAMGK